MYMYSVDMYSQSNGLDAALHCDN